MSGALIVSTPQDVALADARRGVNMFSKVQVPVSLSILPVSFHLPFFSVLMNSAQQILGIIENMSCFVCPKCHEPSYIFGKEGTRRTATEMGLECLGEVLIKSYLFNAFRFNPFFQQHFLCFRYLWNLK